MRGGWEGGEGVCGEQCVWCGRGGSEQLSPQANNGQA